MPKHRSMLRRTSVIAAVFLMLAIAQLSAQAALRFYVIIVDQLTLENILDTQFRNLQRLSEQGAMGLMNTATAGSTTPENAAVTIGAGSRALGPTSSGQAFDLHSLIKPSIDSTLPAESFVQALTPHGLSPATEAEQVYFRRTGNHPDGHIVNLSITEILSANRSLNYEVEPGALGSALADAGVRIHFFGNADTYLPRRHMTGAFMDKSGVIAEGSVEIPVVVDADRPFGIRTDYDYMVRVITGDDDADHGVSDDVADEVLVFELADLARLYDASLSYTERAVAAMRHETLEQLDDLIGAILEKAGEADHLLVLAPTPPRHEVAAGNTFAPLVLWGKEPSMRGTLTSATTRRVGIVANVDIAPTILSTFGVEIPDSMHGHRLAAVSTPNTTQLLTALLERTVAVGIQRREILRPIVIGYIALYAITLLYIMLRPGVIWAHKALLFALPMMAAMPLALLILPLFRIDEALIALGVAILLALFISFLARYSMPDPLWTTGSISVATAIAVLVDSYTGNHLIQSSVLGYDPMGGARFYGIGNEYMGVLVGSTIMGTTALLDIFPRSRPWLRPVLLVFYIVVLLTIALPTVGANVGGGITASVSLALTALLVYRGGLTGRRVALVLGIPILVVGASIAFDLYLNPGGPSHLGKAIQLIDANGLSEVIGIVRRKALMNLKLFRYSIWSRAFVIALVVLSWLLYRPTRLISEIKQRYPGLVLGLIGTTVGALIALVVNDSGVVAGSLVLHFAVSAILYITARLLSPSREVSSDARDGS